MTTVDAALRCLT